VRHRRIARVLTTSKSAGLLAFKQCPKLRSRSEYATVNTASNMNKIPDTPATVASLSANMPSRLATRNRRTLGSTSGVGVDILQKLATAT
jgi:hypothetical protein